MSKNESKTQLNTQLNTQNGILYVVATPIGNMADITLRALETLKNVDLILSEDTRETQKLLEKYDIDTHQISYRDQNHTKVFAQIQQHLELGSKIAIVSDSGTPLISDPGFKLVEALIEMDVPVETIPGPSAVIAALSVAGLPTDKFAFLGFLPKKASHISKTLEKYGELDSTLVIYESPFRVKKLLQNIEDTLPNRYVVLCRELTKIYEECIRGYTEELLDTDFKEKGEFVVLIAKKGYSPKK